MKFDYFTELIKVILVIVIMPLFVEAFFFMIFHPSSLFEVIMEPELLGKKDLLVSRYRIMANFIRAYLQKILMPLIDYLVFIDSFEYSFGELMRSFYLFNHSKEVDNVIELVKNVLRSGNVASVNASMENLSLFIVPFLS